MDRLVDQSPGRRNGALTDSWAWPGISYGHQGIDFSGDGYANAGPLGGFIADRPMSFSAWVRAVSGGFNRGIFSATAKDTSWNSGMGCMQVGTALHFWVMFWSGASRAIVTDLPFDRWVHVAGVWDSAGEIRVYLDGQVGSTTGTRTDALDDLTEDVWLGRMPGGAAYQWPGEWDDFRLYNRALTVPEIQLLGLRPGIAYDLTSSLLIETEPAVVVTTAPVRTLVLKEGDRVLSMAAGSRTVTTEAGDRTLAMAVGNRTVVCTPSDSELDIE